MIARLLLIAPLACSGGGGATWESGGDAQKTSARVAINEIMANPRAVPDERGEWFELRNLGGAAVDLRGWTIASGNDAPHVITARVPIAPGEYAVLGRDADSSRNGGVDVAYAYGNALALGNGRDWLALRAPGGRTADSVAWSGPARGMSHGVRDAGQDHAIVGGSNWTTASRTYGAGDSGTPGADNDGAVTPSAPSPRPLERGTPTASGRTPVTARANKTAEVVVQVLDVGQGDAIYIINGTSRVLIDGGPDAQVLGRHFDRLGLDRSTIDAVILTHQHYDHHAGLRELFRSSRRIAVRRFFENRDAYTNVALAELRDSVAARRGRGELTVHDTDDPCGDGRPVCTLALDGAAKLHILRPDPRPNGPNNRSAAVKLVGPDSTGFIMWLSGDAERTEIDWFDATGYDDRPGMRAPLMKVNHHGSCDGITRRYLDLIRPVHAIVSLAAENDYGYVHSQTAALLRERGITWYRTDQNGTVTIRSPGTGGEAYTITVERGLANMTGLRDRSSTQEECR